jgi:hypothetical protein
MDKKKMSDTMEKVHDVAEKLQLQFPNPMEAMFSLTVILAGMARATGLPLSVVQQMLKDMYNVLEEQDNDEPTNLH